MIEGWHIRLHLGAGDLSFPGWVNMDKTRGHDVSRGLPDWDDDSVESIYSCHLLEHLDYIQGERLVRDVFRVLRPGGVIRLGVPDFRLFAEAYIRGDEEFSRGYFERYLQPDPDFDEAVWTAYFEEFGASGALMAVIFGWEHRAIYDEGILRRVLSGAGFPPESILRSVFGESHYFGEWGLDLHFEDHTLFMEAQKPWQGSS